LAHLKKLEPDADKLPLDVRLSFYRALGQCYYQQKPADLNNAVAAYQKFLTLSPGEVAVLNNLAYILAEEMKPPKPEAAKEFSKRAYEIALDWRRSDEKARVYDTHGWVLVLNGGSSASGPDATEGIRILQEVADDFPILEAHYHLGVAQLRRKKAPEAEEQLSKAAAMIAKAEKEKTPYDETLKPLVEKALAQAKALNAAAAR
jgi:tetratricopeptide (TPR) repeat protein